MRGTRERPPFGAGVLGAHFRMGLGEFRNIFYQESPIAVPTDYGMWGMNIPSEAAAPRRGEDQSKDDKDSVIDDRLQQIGPSREDPSRDDREMDRE
jgi:hypothetical protein